MDCYWSKKNKEQIEGKKNKKKQHLNNSISESNAIKQNI